MEWARLFRARACENCPRVWAFSLYNLESPKLELVQNRLVEPGASLKFSPGLRSYIHDTKEDPSFSTQRGEMPEGQPIGKLGSIIRARIKKQLDLSCSETKSSFEEPTCQEKHWRKAWLRRLFFLESHDSYAVLFFGPFEAVPLEYASVNNSAQSLS